MGDKVNDQHFNPLNEYKYNLIEVEPRKSDLEIIYNELKERKKYLDSAIILEEYNVFAVKGMKKENALMLDRIKEIIYNQSDEIQKGGITNNSEGHQMVYRKCPNCGHDNTRKESLASKYTCKYCEGGLND